MRIKFPIVCWLNSFYGFTLAKVDNGALKCLAEIIVVSFLALEFHNLYKQLTEDG